MANIILDEKRFLNYGEVCAIDLSHIKPVHLTLEDEQYVNFVPDVNGIANSNEITFVKYLSNGLFMDLVSDGLYMASIYSADDFGTDEFDALDMDSKDELEKMANQWDMVQAPENTESFKKSASIFMNNPLVIDMSSAPLMSITSELAVKFASQSLEQVKSKMMSLKTMARQNMQQEYKELESKIVEYYNSKTNSATRTM